MGHRGLPEERRQSAPLTAGASRGSLTSAFRSGWPSACLILELLESCLTSARETPPVLQSCTVNLWSQHWQPHVHEGPANSSLCTLGASVSAGR